MLAQRAGPAQCCCKRAARPTCAARPLLLLGVGQPCIGTNDCAAAHVHIVGTGAVSGTAVLLP
jgi:hypothetical protein